MVYQSIVVEGNAGSGKTYVTSRLASELSATRIPEYMEITRVDFLDRLRSGPALPIELFFHIEQFRIRMAKLASGHSIFDRSFLSVLAFAYAVDGPEWKSLIEGNLPNEIYAHRFEYPVVFLFCPRGQRAIRARGRPDTMPKLYFERQFSDRFDFFFETLRKHGYTSTINNTIEMEADAVASAVKSTGTTGKEEAHFTVANCIQAVETG